VSFVDTDQPLEKMRLKGLELLAQETPECNTYSDGFGNGYWQAFIEAKPEFSALQKMLAEALDLLDDTAQGKVHDGMQEWQDAYNRIYEAAGKPERVEVRPWFAATAPTDLWSEDGEFLWLRGDLAEDGDHAKRIAFVGHDPKRRVVLPETFLGGERWGYGRLRARRITLRPSEPDEHGSDESADDTWWRCEPEHPKAVAYWQVTAR